MPVVLSKYELLVVFLLSESDPPRLSLTTVSNTTAPPSQELQDALRGADNGVFEITMNMSILVPGALIETGVYGKMQRLLQIRFQLTCRRRFFPSDRDIYCRPAVS